MKKIFALLLALSLVLALCACGADTETAVEEAVTEEVAEVATELEDEPAEPVADVADAASGEAEAAPEEPIAAEDQPVADHADAVEAEIPEGAVYLAFTGDEHGETSGYRVWLEDILAVYGDSLALLSYSGDICEKNWESDVFDTFKGILDELVPGRYNVTTGNQEWKSGAPGADFASLGDEFTIYGEVSNTDSYCVYDFGSMSESMSFPQEEIDALDAYLAEVPADKPVFVLSHFPLHLSCATDSHSIPGGDHRQSEGNGDVIEMLNQYPNVIFLWGHNHTFQDPRYGTICPAGSQMTWNYDDPTDKKTINFTYANYGSFCRGDSYGILSEVLDTEEGVQVTLNYIDTNVPMTDKDSAVLSFAADGTVSASVTEGTGIDYDEIVSMSGYADDAAFMDTFRG